MVPKRHRWKVTGTRITARGRVLLEYECRSCGLRTDDHERERTKVEPCSRWLEGKQLRMAMLEGWWVVVDDDGKPIGP